jgi:hypothetical protein
MSEGGRGTASFRTVCGERGTGVKLIQLRCAVKERSHAASCGGNGESMGLADAGARHRRHCFVGDGMVTCMMAWWHGGMHDGMVVWRHCFVGDGA